ncbi:MAG: trypsin-like peptidase domain-containing protein [Myxococcales bacterium]|nr:trypsin-like peptidase domain-containing protein [Myxococcales bacterium]
MSTVVERGGWVVATVVAAGLALAGGYAVGVRQNTWPSYASVFDQVKDGVVSVVVAAPTARVGSGFAVSGDELVTARHLVMDAEAITVRDVDGHAVDATLVGADARTDLALLKVEGAHLRPLVLGASEPMPVGATLIAIGSPYGLAHSLAVGVLAGRGRRLQEEGGGPRVDFLQLAIPLNPGNSGGPVIDEGGRVVGVLSGTHAQGQAISFAVPVEILSSSLPTLRSGALLSRAFLGVRVERDGDSVVVSQVVASSPADRAGIRPGDRLSAFDDVPIATPADLTRALDALAGGSRATMRLLRDGQLQLVDVQLADWAEQSVVIGGMTLRPAPGAGGEVVAVRPRSRAEVAGIEVGDVVRSVDGAPARAPADIRDALASGEPAQLDVVRDGAPVSVQLAGSF